ncbi:MAG: PDZ domain-containing protein [Deltaproteobacteria bacterium]|nr:PDZ domain-containing protein [Deltaproteobacteria bacterium]
MPTLKKFPGFIILTLTLVLLTGKTVSASADVQNDEILALKNTSRAFVRIARDVTPSVVNIKTFRKGGGPASLGDHGFGDMLEPFREFFGDDFTRRFFRTPDERMVQLSLGSGVIVRPEGIVLTNNHVIKGADLIKVTLQDRTEIEASVVGSDPRTDIAVLKLPRGSYPSARMGDSDSLEVGEWVVAIGNPFGLGKSVTVGVVSAKGRANVGIADLEDFIQTDAAINPGNSGGPLINLQGEVIGINTAIFSRSGGYQGIGFAIPSNMVKTILESLLKTGKVVRTDLGLRVQEATGNLIDALGAGDRRGVVVNEVIPGSVAEKAGIVRGDLIARVRGRDVPDVNIFYTVVSLLPVDEKVPVVVIRKGIPITIMVKAGFLPPRPQDSSVRLRTALGFSVEELTEDVASRLGYRYERGVLVTAVVRYSKADRAGIEPGDLVLGVNGHDTPDLKAFQTRFKAMEWGSEVALKMERGTKTYSVTMILTQ